MGKILIIEDELDIRESVKILLESEGFFVYEAENGEAGLQKLTNDTQLVILDIMMNGMSGIKVCKEIRKSSFVPVLFLTAKAQESDKLLGLMAGGDDYLTKPFSYAELLGRVKALIRRYNDYNSMPFHNGKSYSQYLISGSLKVNTQFNEVFVNSKSIDLTNIEYKILLLLMQNQGKIFSAQNLYESIWNEPYFYNCSGIVMVHIRNLRTKIEPNSQEPTFIKTVWGRGYRFEEPAN